MSQYLYYHQVDLYGGYSNMETAYLCLVQYKGKKKLIGIPMSVAVISKKDKLSKSKFIKEHLNLKENEDITILKDNIPYETEIIYKNQNIYLKGFSVSHKNCELSNARQLKIRKEYMIKWKKALEYILNNNKNYEMEAIKYSDDIVNYLLSLENEYPLFAKEITRIREKLDLFELTLQDKKRIIVELFKLFHCNSVNANLSSYNLGDRIGRLSGNNVTTGVIFNKSVTGIKESFYEF